MSILIGVALGMITSLVSWWLVARALIPRLALSPTISKLPARSEKAAWRYSVKIANRRRWWLPDRPLIDVHIAATLRIRGIGEIPTGWSIFRVPVGEEGVVEVLSSPRVFTLRIYDIRTDRGGFWSVPQLREAIASGTIELEALLSSGSEAELQVAVSAVHSYTQARNTILATYTREDIVSGRFAADTGMSVIEASIPTAEDAAGANAPNENCDFGREPTRSH